MSMLHTMLLLRVGDEDDPEGKFTLAFVGYGDEAAHTVLEPTHKRGGVEQTNRAPPSALSRWSWMTRSAAGAAMGGKVTRPVGSMKHGGTVIACVEDADGYKFEFIDKGTRAA